MATQNHSLPRIAARGHILEAGPLPEEAWHRLLGRRPSVPRTFEELHALAHRLFVHPEEGKGEAPGGIKSGTRLLRDLHLGLMNPALTPEHVERLDAKAAVRALSPFNKETSTEHFVIKWSDDAPDPGIGGR